MDDNIIWIFREMRSGSSWFTAKLSNTLNRKAHFFDIQECAQIDPSQRGQFFLNRKQQVEDYNKILNTHYFLGLSSLSNYDNPIVFRVTRRNKTEQFLSEYLVTLRNQQTTNVENQSDIEKLPTIDKSIVPLKLAKSFVARHKEYDNLWKQYSIHYRNEVVYYEDLLEKYQSTILPLGPWKMNNVETEPGLTYKLPYDKQELILNYKDVKNVIETAFN